jgi:hypothetical protein
MQCFSSGITLRLSVKAVDRGQSTVDFPKTSSRFF